MSYTYLIGWSKLDAWYYGVRYAKRCKPSELWRTYFTSSRYVHDFRALHGEPDVIEIRKIFGTQDKAILWESRVLRRLDVIHNSRWLNRTNNQAIRDGSNRAYGPSWNKGKTGMKRSESSIQKQKETITGKKRGPYDYNHEVCSISVLFRGKIYPSIAAARRDTGASFRTVKRYSRILTPDQKL